MTRRTSDKKNFRQEAIAKNRKLLVSTQSNKKRIAWFHGLKVGDVFWYGETFDEMIENKYEVSEIRDLPLKACPGHVQDNIAHYVHLMPCYRVIGVKVNDNPNPNAGTLTQDCFAWKKLSMTKPYPLKDELCGSQR